MDVEGEPKKYEFWPDKIAEELVKHWEVKKHVITTGTSMSGEPHIGSANDVIRGDAIKLSLLRRKVPAELVWISDDLDPFRSVPADLPSELKDYLGVPAAFIPDFWGCHKSFTEHFEEKFVKQLESVFVKPTVLLGVNMYRKGMYNDVIKIAMGKREEVAEILNKYREHKLKEDWYPVDIVCENCKKISTTKIINYDPKNSEAEYVCRQDEIILHKKNPVSGCGHSGKISILDGNSKLTWRVEWASRWSFLKSTCEPFGKEHAAAGGSWDTGKEIAEKIYDYKPPYTVVYEHFLVDGAKMSKSRGNVITVPDMLRYMTPAHLRYWMFQGRLTIAKNIIMKEIIPRLFSDFDMAERVYFDPNVAETERERTNLSRAYELAVIEIPKVKSPIEIIKTHVPFEMLKQWVKIMPESGWEDFLMSKLEGNGFSTNKFAMAKIHERIILVKNWIKDFEKEETKYLEVSPRVKTAINNLIEAVKSAENENDLQNKIFQVADQSRMQPNELFKAVYLILLNSEKGPRLASYILEVGREEVIKKLKTFVN